MIGLGGVGQRHLRNIRTLIGDGADVLAYRVRRLSHVVTPQLQSDESRDVEKVYGVRVFDDLAAALAEKPDVAFICNPSSMHVPVALACVQAGCDIFLEKPVSNSLDGALELLEEVNRTGRVAMVGYQLRFHPCIVSVREAITEGKIGNVLSIRATVGEYLPGWHPYEDYRQMYAARADLGGGVIVSQIHEFDYLYALLGMPKRIFTVGGHLSRLEIDVEDVADTLMEFRQGERVIPVQLHQDYVQRPSSRGCEIVGDCGKLSMDLPSLSFMRYDGEGNVADSRRWENLDRNELFLNELRHFFECVETRQRPVPDLHDGICSLRMALAAKESMVSGSAITIGEVV